MSIRNIVIEPDPILRKKSEPLHQFNSDTRKLLDDMLETMYAAPGIGLAAVQIGILKRLIVIDISQWLFISESVHLTSDFFPFLVPIIKSNPFFSFQSINSL